MSLLLKALLGHVLSLIEKELVQNEPALVADVESEIQLLISRLENYLTNKSPLAAELVNPVLSGTVQAINAGVSAVGNAAVAESQGG